MASYRHWFDGLKSAEYARLSQAGADSRRNRSPRQYASVPILLLAVLLIRRIRSVVFPPIGRLRPRRSPARARSSPTSGIP